MNSKTEVTFRWTSSDEGQAFQSHVNEQTLSVTRITSFDVSNYTCVASTAKSAGSATVTVEVLKPSSHHATVTVEVLPHNYHHATTAAARDYNVDSATTSADDIGISTEENRVPGASSQLQSATHQMSSNVNEMNTVIISGTVGGGLVLLAIMTLLVIVLVKRQSRKGN